MASATTTPSSPTFTDTSVSSFDILTPRSRSSTFSSGQELQFTSSDDSDDEIVWGVSSSHLYSSSLSTESSPNLGSEEDFVVLSRNRSRNGYNNASHEAKDSSDELSKELVSLSLRTTSSRGKSSSQKAQKSSNISSLKVATPTTDTSSLPDRPDSTATVTRSTKKRRPRSSPKKSRSPIGLGARDIVDDISEVASVKEEGVKSSTYEDAANYISSFLSNPSAYTNAGRLPFLQALVVELGLATSSLPGSIKAAKAIIKSSAFINISEYLAVRSQGLAAVQGILYPSKSALVRDIRRTHRTVARPWVKKNGLDVLLVTCYH